MIATAALVILAWEFKKERNEHQAKQKEAESKLLKQKKQNEAQSETHQILERELQLQKAREVAKEQAKTRRISDDFDRFKRESAGGDTVPRSEATRLADEAAVQASLLAKTEVTDRLSTVLGWDVSRNGEATLDGLIDLIEGYVEAYRENQLLKLGVLERLNELLTKYGITSLNDLSEFDPKVLEESVNASILEAGDTGAASARGELSEMLNSIYDQVADGRGSKDVSFEQVGSAIDALAQRELEVRAALEKLEKETLIVLRKENQTLKLANDELKEQIRSLSVSVDPMLTPSKTLAPEHVSSTIDFRIRAAVTKALEDQALEHKKALRKETEAARLIIEKASQENTELRKRVEAAELASQQASRSIEERARENRDLQARFASLLEEVESHKAKAAKWHELHTQLQHAHARTVAEARGTPRSAMKGGRGHDRGRTPNRVSFTPGREGERSHSPIMTPTEIARQREAEETLRLEALKKASADERADHEDGSEDGSSLASGRPKRNRRAPQKMTGSMTPGGVHYAVEDAVDVKGKGGRGGGRGGKGGRGKRK